MVYVLRTRTTTVLDSQCFVFVWIHVSMNHCTRQWMGIIRVHFTDVYMHYGFRRKEFQERIDYEAARYQSLTLIKSIYIYTDYRKIIKYTTWKSLSVLICDATSSANCSVKGTENWRSLVKCAINFPRIANDHCLYIIIFRDMLISI